MDVTTPPHMAARVSTRQSRELRTAAPDTDSLAGLQQRLLARAWLHDAPATYAQGVRDVVGALREMTSEERVATGSGPTSRAG